MADVERQWVTIESSIAPRAKPGNYSQQGVYHSLKGTRPKVAFIFVHHVGDFTDHYMAKPLAERGFGVLGMNTRYSREPAYFQLEFALADVGAGVQWLREVAGAETVVLVGNSGGGSLMATYQAQATSPDTISVDQSGNSDKSGGGLIALTGGFNLSGIAEVVNNLPAGDLYISFNAHQGRPDVLTSWMDPAVIDENDLLASDPELDLFHPDNKPPYSDEFLAKYRAAQRDRNDRITQWARDELKRLNAVGIKDRMFTINRLWADPRFVDLSIDPSDREVGCYGGDAQSANYGSVSLVPYSTLRGWLSMWSLQDAQCRGVDHFRNIVVPSLVVQGTRDQGVFPSDARAIYEHLGAKDKSIELLPGGHYFEDSPESLENAVDVVVDWTQKRLG